MKIALIVIDGLGDSPIDELGKKTPLEAAITPNLDALASNGVCGLIEPFCFSWQKYPRSDSAHLALFGYDPAVYCLGRGVYEAIGKGMKMKKENVALRANFGTVDKNLKIIDRRAGRIDNTESLVKSLAGIEIDNVKFKVAASLGHRAILLLKGKNLSEKIGGGDIKKTGIRVKKIVVLEKSKQAEFTADVLNKFLEKAHRILENHPLNKKRKKQGLLPANYLLVRGAGKLRETPSFNKKYNLKAACIAAGYVYRGVAKVLGMDLINVKGATGNINTNLKGKILSIKRNLKKYNFIFCHIKAADTLSEDGNCLGKKKFIEKIDNNMKFLTNLKNTLIVVTADHSSCCKFKRHCTSLVPVLIYESSIRHRGEKVSEFSEKACRKGRLGKFKQTDLMSRILKLKKKYEHSKKIKQEDV